VLRVEGGVVHNVSTKRLGGIPVFRGEILGIREGRIREGAAKGLFRKAPSILFQGGRCTMGKDYMPVKDILPEDKMRRSGPKRG